MREPMFLDTAGYRRDTDGLSTTDHGIYLLLLMHCWNHGEPLPLDEQRLATITNRRSEEELVALRYVINRFFLHTDAGWIWEDSGIIRGGMPGAQ